jgi:hypothetical protein
MLADLSTSTAIGLGPLAVAAVLIIFAAVVGTRR